MSTHRGPFIFTEISIIFSRSRSRPEYRGRVEQSRTNFGRSWTLRDRVVGSRFEIIEETSPIKRQGGITPARFPSTIPSKRVAKLCPGLQSTATYRKYPLSSLPPLRPFTCFSIAFESHGDKFSFSLMETVDSTWFSSARFLFVDDRQGERTSGCRSTIASSSRRKESSTQSLANRRDERERIIEHRWATAVSGVTILLSLTVFLNLVAETLPQVSDAIPLLGTTEFLHRANVRVNRRTVDSLQRPRIDWEIERSRMVLWWIEIVKIWSDLRGDFVR